MYLYLPHLLSSSDPLSSASSSSASCQLTERKGHREILQIPAISSLTRLYQSGKIKIHVFFPAVPLWKSLAKLSIYIWMRLDPRSNSSVPLALASHGCKAEGLISLISILPALLDHLWLFAAVKMQKCLGCGGISKWDVFYVVLPSRDKQALVTSEFQYLYRKLAVTQMQAAWRCLLCYLLHRRASWTINRNL